MELAVEGGRGLCAPLLLGFVNAAWEDDGAAMPHVPVMREEVLDYLSVRPDGVYVDCTVGTGGHALLLGKRLSPRGTLIGIDRDPEALEVASARLSGLGCRVRLVRAPFARLEDVLDEMGVGRADGFLFDLGISSAQLDDPSRGFAFRMDGPLDMRMNRTAGKTAADLVNSLPQEELAQVIARFGQERFARRIARAIVKARAKAPLRTTGDLVRAVLQAVPTDYERGRIHPATRTFQALRIAVNDELGQLEAGLCAACRRVEPGGRIVVISYHSLEDGVAKRVFRRAAHGCTCGPEAPACTCGGFARVGVLTRKPLRPTPEEVAANPRARSARMRVAEGV